MRKWSGFLCHSFLCKDWLSFTFLQHSKEWNLSKNQHPLFIYLFGRESKGAFHFQMVWKKWEINAIVNGHKFYIILWRGISKKFIFFLKDLVLCILWFRTSSSLSGSAWRIFFFGVSKMVGAVYRLTRVCNIRYILS